jgi:hypothetical protein
MITVPDSVKSALLATSRFIKIKVRLEIDGVLTDINEAMTVDTDCTASGTGSDDLPFGIVTCNAATIVFDNLSHKFTLDNKDSIYYGRLKAGAKVIINFLVLTGTTWYTLPDTIWYTDSWKCNTSDNTATVSCLDSLSQYKDKEVPAFPVQKNIQVGKAYALLFKQMGISSSQYVIDDTLTSPIIYFWKLGDTFQAQLENLAQSTLTNVYTTTDGIIHVSSLVDKKTSAMTIQDTDLIISTDAQPTYEDTYTGCKIKYKTLADKTQQIIYESKDMSLAPGVTNLTGLKFTASPVLAVLAVTVNGGTSVSILNVTCTSETMDITLSNNTNKTQTVTLQAHGTILTTADATASAVNKSSTASSDNILEISMAYILTPAIVQLYSQKILYNYNGNYVTMTISTRGLPILELYDKITVNSPSSKLNKEFRIKKMSLSFDSGLEGDLTVSVPADKVASKYVFIGPGMIIGI